MALWYSNLFYIYFLKFITHLLLYLSTSKPCDSITFLHPVTGNNSASILSRLSKFCNLSEWLCDDEFREKQLVRVSSHMHKRSFNLLHRGTMLTIQANCIIKSEVVSNASCSPGFRKFTGQTSIYRFLLTLKFAILYQSNCIENYV